MLTAIAFGNHNASSLFEKKRIKNSLKVDTCNRMSRSALCFFSKRWLWKFSRAFSISASSSGDPSFGSNSHTCLPTWLFNVRSHALPPSAIFSFHMSSSHFRGKKKNTQPHTGTHNVIPHIKLNFQFSSESININQFNKLPD